MKFERRSVFGWPATAAGWAPCKNGLVVHYDGSNQSLANKQHSSCRTYWKNTRSFHMDSRRWLDIGYSFAVCPHGYVLEGRGWQRQQAAQPSGNSTWTSVTFMSGPSETPTHGQIKAFRELRAWLRAKGLTAAVSYHGRFISTSCPGPILRGMVTSGSLISGGSAPAPTPQPTPPAEETLKTVVDLGARVPQTVPAGERRSLVFEREYLDPDKVHTDAKEDTRYPSIFPKGADAPYAVTVQLVLDGKPAEGVMVSLASYERDSNTFDRDVRFEDVLAARHIMHANLRMSDRHKYRADIVNDSAADVVVNDAFLLIAH